MSHSEPGRRPRVALLDALFRMPRSVSVPRMFAQIRVALEHACEVEQLPPDYLDLADQERRACLQSLLRRSDVALLAGVVSRRRLAEVFAPRPHDSFPIPTVSVRLRWSRRWHRG